MWRFRLIVVAPRMS